MDHAPNAAQFAVGIDLGTTHTVVAWAPLDGAHETRVFPIPQLVAPAAVEARPLFASMLYAPLEGERVDDPFGDAPYALGEIARRRGTEVPGRLIASSKSWLVHSGVDRTAAVLPWGAPDDVPKCSPVDAAARLLAHVRRAWDERVPDAPLAAQEVVLTVPASFDEVARELSIEAARRAGLMPKLLEEPQAAFYDWMARSGRRGVEQLLERTSGEATVLVVDVGGGTTDLSLIRATGPGDVARIAVGPHVLLGGDNMDLALAHACEPYLVGGDAKLDPARFAQLVLACRTAKEVLLGVDAPDDAPITVLARGASLVGQARTTRLTRADAEQRVVEGFFPRVPADARPQRARSAVVAFGLPYERDPAITRHLAAFLARHPGARPNAVLLNGGVFRAARLVERLLETVGGWRGGDVLRLPDADPDLAVARGAVAYMQARHGRGVRIGGGSARGYFVGVGADAPAAVCVVPRGADEGVVHVVSDRIFALAVGRPVRFELFASDEVVSRPGELVAVDGDAFVRLPPLAATLAGPKGGEVIVRLEGEVTPIGTVDLAFVEAAGAPRPRRFRLAFQLRGENDAPALPVASAGRWAAPTGAGAARLEAALERIDRAFGKPRADAGGREARDLLRDLEKALGERAEWTCAVNRALFDALLPAARARRRSADHERLFWWLAGWSIRPGFGHPGDPGRVQSLFALFDERLAFPGEARVWQQFWIAWRRGVGGLDQAAQTRIRDFVDVHLAPAGSGRRPKKPALALDDALEMAAAMERLEPARRSELGGWVLDRTWTDRDPRLWSAIGRIGARVPAYASVHHVVVPTIAERWLDHLMREKWDLVPTAVEAALRLSRRTGDRARDVGDAAREQVVKRLVAAGASEEQVRTVREVVAVADAERVDFFGDSLPLGLTLVDASDPPSGAGGGPL